MNLSFLRVRLKNGDHPAASVALDPIGKSRAVIVSADFSDRP